MIVRLRRVLKTGEVRTRLFPLRRKEGVSFICLSVSSHMCVLCVNVCVCVCVMGVCICVSSCVCVVCECVLYLRVYLFCVCVCVCVCVDFFYVCVCGHWWLSGLYSGFHTEPWERGNFAFGWCVCVCEIGRQNIIMVCQLPGQVTYLTPTCTNCN